jgi:hypothetical protein
MGIAMVIMGTMYASGSVHPESGAGRWVVIVMIFVFAVIFSITWAICIKIYASEIQPQHTRGPATSLGQSANWVSDSSHEISHNDINIRRLRTSWLLLRLQFSWLIPVLAFITCLEGRTL